MKNDETNRKCSVSCRYVRLAVLPCPQASRCLFRTRSSPPQDVVEINEVFGMQISHGALRHKTLRVDVCNAGRSGLEDCVVSFYTQVLRSVKLRWMIPDQ